MTVATLALPPPEGDDRAERLEKAEGLAAAVGAYADVFVEDPGGDPEVVHRFARMLLALEEFELACLCPERSSDSSGSIYTITYSATDASGNTTLGQTTVTVPR